MEITKVLGKYHFASETTLSVKPMNVLLVKNLYVSIEKKSIIENLSFVLAERDALSILGPNGAGKTVLLKALLKLLPYSGEIIWAPVIRIGYVPQKLDADRHLPLTFANLFVAKCKTLKVAIADIKEVSESVGLTKELLGTPVGHLSGGQFQRGLIAFALIGKPNVLLLDEPTAGIDEPGEEHIYELVDRLQDQYELAAIMVSHDLSFVSRYATKVLCLNKQSVCLGTPQEALAPEVLEKLYGAPFGYYHHDHGESHRHQ
jgi:zinc transport system ATP-binding protein